MQGGLPDRRSIAYGAAVGKQVGQSTGGIETSKKWRRKKARQRRAQEQEWASKNGPVIVRVGDREVYVKADRVKQDLAAARKVLLGAIDQEHELEQEQGPPASPA